MAGTSSPEAVTEVKGAHVPSGVAVLPVRDLDVDVRARGRVLSPAEVAPVDLAAGVEDAGGERARRRVGAEPQPVDREARAAGVEVARDQAQILADGGRVRRDEDAVHEEADLARRPLDPEVMRRARRDIRDRHVCRTRARAGEEGVRRIPGAEEDPRRLGLVVGDEANVLELGCPEGGDELERAAGAEAGEIRDGAGAVDDERAAAHARRRRRLHHERADQPAGSAVPENSSASVGARITSPSPA